MWIWTSGHGGDDAGGHGKKTVPGAKIVFATAYSQYAAKAYEMEIDDYILKPFGPERVHHVVKNALGKENVIPREKWRSRRKNGTGSSRKQEAEQGNAGVEERREAMVFGKIPVTASRGILFLEIAQIVYAGDRRTRVWSIPHRDPIEVNQLLGELEKSWRTSDSSGSIRAIL